MGISSAELTIRQNELHTKIKERNPNAICDGVLDVETYCSLKRKIMWVQKEAPVSGGGILYEDVWNGKTGVLGGYNSTLRWKTEVSRHLLEDELKQRPLPENDKFISEISKYPSDKQLSARILCCIANINVGKESGPNKTSDTRLQNIYHKWEDITHEQLELYTPDIIFFSGTFKLFNFSNLQELWSSRIVGNDFHIYYATIGDRQTIVVDCYHTGAAGRGIGTYWNALGVAACECVKF